MNGVILQEKEVYYDNEKLYYTNLKLIIQACGLDEKQYNWLITSYECNYYPNKELENKRHEYIWLSGNEFNKLINHDTLQFIWGIIVSFPLTVSKDEVLELPLPTYQKDEYLHLLSIFEIVSEDSTLVKVFSKQNEYIQKFTNNIPEVKKI